MSVRNRPLLCSPVKVLQQYNIWLNAQIITLSEFLSALLNTVSYQAEAYFGAGTKLTVLGKKSFLSSLKIRYKCSVK